MLICGTGELVAAAVPPEGSTEVLLHVFPKRADHIVSTGESLYV